MDVCMQLNKAEMILLKYLSSVMVDNEVEPVGTEGWNHYLKISLMKYYKHLCSIGVMKRIYRGRYMLNPYLMVVDNGAVGLQNKWDIINKG